MPFKGFKHSEETKRRLSEISKGNKSNLGRVFPMETKRKMSLAKMGNKNAVGSKGHLGMKHSEEARVRMSRSHLGKELTEKHKRKISEVTSGSNNPNWKGGVTPLRIKIHNSNQYKIWRNKVFKRDNYTCQVCKQVRGDINAHHIKSFAEYPERRFWVNNGITLCKMCHKLTDNYLKQIKRIENIEQISLFAIQ